MKINITNKFLEKIKEMYINEGLSIYKISKEFNIPESATRRIMIKNNIKIRSRKENSSGEKNGMYGKQAWNKDKPWSQEIKDKMSVPHPTTRGRNHLNYGKPPHHSQRVFPHLSPLQGEILMHRWDRIYAEYLDSIGELYVYEQDFFEMNINGKETSYTPDFYLPFKNKYVEIKGYWRDDAKEKSDKFKEIWSHCFNYEVLTQKDLTKLGIDLRVTQKEREILNLLKRNKEV